MGGEDPSSNLKQVDHDDEVLKIVVLISGSGSNLQALIDNVPSFKNPRAKINLVISNSKFAYGIERAKASNIPTQIFSMATFRKNFNQSQNHHQTKKEGEEEEEETEEEKEKTKRLIRLRYDEELARLVKSGEPDLVVLAGFMHILSKEFLELMRSDWKKVVNDEIRLEKIPIINLHPALPGQFDGANAIKRAYEAGPNGSNQITQTGVMVHEVISEVDKGSPILTEPVELIKDEPIESLEKRIHEVEHKLIVKATYEILKKISNS